MYLIFHSFYCSFSMQFKCSFPALFERLTPLWRRKGKKKKQKDKGNKFKRKNNQTTSFPITAGKVWMGFM